jgi:hypothetical protein
MQGSIWKDWYAISPSLSWVYELKRRRKKICRKQLFGKLGVIQRRCHDSVASTPEHFGNLVIKMNTI